MKLSVRGVMLPGKVFLFVHFKQREKRFVKGALYIFLTGWES